ncbi:plasma membrane calcium [Arthrobotrys musiformis]|uniref:Calcium-transporting ATPase n=1 Tax=Arthrobotrys musiformis TaxID=47236 RepID=A0AAV9W1L3_9PEZI
MAQQPVPSLTVSTDQHLTITPANTSPTGRSRSESFGSPTTPTNSYLTAGPHHVRHYSTASSIGGSTLRPRSSSVGMFDGVSPEEALKPDLGTENDFKVENNPFAFAPGHLNKMLNPKSLSAYQALGGVFGIAKGLKTDLRTGLSIDETTIGTPISFNEAVTSSEDEPKKETYSQAVHIPHSGDSGPYADRLRVFKDNTLPEKKATPLWRLMWNAYKDEILLLLTAAAVISLALGLYETFRKHPESEEESGVKGADWIEGVAIIVAIVIVVLVGAINDYQKEKQFVKLNKKKDSREIKVVRSGKSILVSVYDLMVGDIVHIEPGDLIPTDGIFVEGHNVKCDESSATGESDMMKKTPGEEVWRHLRNGTATAKMDPFVISGAKVLEGVGTYMTTSVGVNSSFGKIMMALRTEAEATPLQEKLNRLAGMIAKLGGSAAGLLFFVLLIKFLVQLPGNHESPAQKASVFTDILITAVTIVVVAIPEGLPLAVTLALAFATTRMLKDNNLVRLLKSCEIMGNATAICSDKTGTLTTNQMTVVAGTIGVGKGFAATENLQEKLSHRSITDAVATFTPVVKDLLVKSIAINSTAFEGEENGIKTFIGSKTETALLTLARDFLGMQPVSEERSNVNVVQVFPFDSGRKCMGVAIKTASGYRLFVKGASEIMLRSASHYLADVSSSNDVSTIAFSTHDRSTVEATINSYAEKSLRTIGMLYKDFPQWPPAEAKFCEDDASAVEFGSILNNCVFIGLVGIQDPLRPGVEVAVAQCQKAGITVRMVTGDNVVTAKAIATECGIYSEGGIVMEGPDFRQLSQPEMDAILPRLQVLARSSPEDKRILVRRLRDLGETVACTGDGTNDAPALHAADVGFAMGIAGTETAKEAAAIILMDDNFASIVKATMWGRAVNDAVQKFLQFQLTVNITAVLLAFVSAVSNDQMKPVLTAVQLLWVNLIMDTFAALALATDPPTPEILDRKPAGKKAPLITLRMWKMIIGQAIFQLAVTFTLYFGGAKILGYTTKEQMDELDTIVFNTFVWMQIFNEFNNRRLDNKLNIFAGIHRNYFFIGINCIMIGGQVLIMYVGGAAFSITHISGSQWAICIVCAAVSLPWAVVIRLIPDEAVRSGWVFCLPLVRFIGRVWDFFARWVLSPIGWVFRNTWRAAKKPFGRSKRNHSDEDEDEERCPTSDEKDTPTLSAPVAPMPAIVVGDDSNTITPISPFSKPTDVEKGIPSPRG